MKNAFWLLLFFGGGLLSYGQFSVDTFPVYAPLETAGFTSGFFDEEDYTGYFLPAQAGNGNYSPMGQLSRNLIGMRFRPRGYDNPFIGYEIHGVELADRVDGFPYWNVISGLNLLAPTHYDVSGIRPSAALPGSVGGVTSLSFLDKNSPYTGRASYALSNRSYRHRLTFQNKTRLSDNLIVSYGLLGHAGDDGFVEGVFSSRLQGAIGLCYYFGADKQHALAFSLTGTLSEQGVRSAATQEVYDLAGDHYYNPNWGYQSGDLRNSRERRYEQYFSILAYEGSLNPGWTFRASVALFGGENSYSLPAWYEAPTLYPDYYRYLPDFYANPAVSDPLREAWREDDPAVTRIDWQKLYESNTYNTDADGMARSHYIIRDLVTEKQNLALGVSLEYRPGRHLTLRGGLRFRSDRSDNYARLNDLLGGSYWLDIDQYLLDDEYYGSQTQNDLRHPDRPVREGDRFGYNYLALSQMVKAWAAVDYNSLDWSGFLALEVGSVTLQREGKYEKEMFPGTRSFGRSEKLDFPEYMLKSGAFWHFSQRSRLGLQAMAGVQAPLFGDVFVSPSTRNEVVPDHGGVRVTGAELLYQWNSPRFSLNLTGYATVFSGDTEIRNFYDDIDGEYMNLALTDIDKIHAGVEIGAEWNLTPGLSLLGVLAAGVYKYDNDPGVTLYRDSDGEMLLSGAAARLSGYHLPGTPQTAAMVQLNYRTRSYWNFQFAGKYTAQNYVSLNPVRRMGRALDLAGSPEIRRQMADQERLDDAFLLSLSVSKNFRLHNGDRIGLWVNVDNLLNNKDIRYSGYEQWRFSRTTSGGGNTLLSFPSKYYYAYGANFYAMISYTF